MKLSPEQIAEVAHEANRVYCEHLGDHTVAYWEYTPEEIRESVVHGVKTLMAFPDLSPEDMHKNWLKYKEETGWRWGEKKDIASKTHPNMMEYNQLPPEQQLKDHLFHAIVRTLAELPKGYVHV